MFQELPLASLHAHPMNSNVMAEERLRKLIEHIRESDQYPPIIVRRLGDEHYQMLDGHHRVAALRALQRATARCDVWALDDDRALMLLATLNRLEGADDPYKRSTLVEALRARCDESTLLKRLPESRADLDALRALASPPPPLRKPRGLAAMPVAVHFFLLPAARARLDAKLREHGGPRETALLSLLGLGEEA